MEDDIQNYLSTVMFRGTPCIYDNFILAILPYKITRTQ